MTTQENVEPLATPVTSGAGSLMPRLYRDLTRRAASLQDVALLAARLVLARTFLLSGLTKWDGFSIRDDTFYLFSDEYFGRYTLPQVLTNIFAIASSIGEIVLPLLLILGLTSRVAAFGLLTMTLVIQTFVYPDAWWSVHIWWTILALLIVTSGPGAISLDRRLKLD